MQRRVIICASIAGGSLLLASCCIAWRQPAGDMRVPMFMSLGSLLVLTVSAAIAGRHGQAWVRRSMRVLSVGLAINALAVGLGVLGSWDYYAARAATWRGDHGEAIEALERSVEAYQEAGFTCVLPIRVSMRVSRRGILLASEAELWLGIARNHEYLGDWSAAREAYVEALRRSRGVWSAERRMEVVRMMERVQERARDGQHPADY